MGEPLRIGICGFGVAGGALAILLGRAGHRVSLLERAPQIGPVGAGFLLQPSGQQVLGALGLREQIVAKAARIERLGAYTEQGRKLTDLRYAAVTGGSCAYGVQRGVLFTTLHAAALEAGATIVLDAEIVGVEETADSATILDRAGRTHGPFDLVIGADGARSWLRQWLNPTLPRREFSYGAWWGTGRSAWPAEELYQVTRSARRLFGLMPVGAGQCAFFWGLRRDEVEPTKARGFAAFRDEVTALCPRAAEILDDLGSFDRLTFALYQDALPERVHGGRVVLAGDAAHAMSPHLGQGANLALLDAECLARQLARLPVPAALAAYARERRSQSRYFALLSRGLSPFFQSDRALLAWGRDLALPMMCAVPWIRRQMELSVAGLKRGFSGPW